MKNYKKPQIKVDYTNNDFSRCWTCKNACNGGCSWSRDFIPVNGWKAEKTFLPSNGEFAESYHVISCPEYKRG